MLGEDLLRQPSHLRERAEVGEVEGDAFVARRLADLAHRSIPFSRVPAVEKHGRSQGGELARERSPEAVRRTRDEDDLLFDRSHASRRA